MKIKHVNMQLDEITHGRLKAHLALQGKTFKDWIEECVAREMENATTQAIAREGVPCLR